MEKKLTSIWIVANPSLGLATKAKACKVAGQDKKPDREQKCEGMNLHTPKGASTLRVGVPVDSQMFRERFQKSKLNVLRSSLYHWKSIET
jgi:hypothetical protein